MEDKNKEIRTPGITPMPTANIVECECNPGFFKDEDKGIIFFAKPNNSGDVDLVQLNQPRK